MDWQGLQQYTPEASQSLARETHTVSKKTEIRPGTKE